MSSPPPEGNAEVLKAIEKAKNEILEYLQREIDVSDGDLKEVIDALRKQIEMLISQAESAARVDLRLDDLFDVVIRLTKSADSIEAVDLEVNRWENDERARNYFAQNLAALQRGAQIKRIYVISPRVTERDLETVQATISAHLDGNEDAEVRAHRGRLDVGVIYHEDVSGHDYRDFAIFDNNKVLIEEFGADWISTFKGRLTKDPGEVADCRLQFSKLWAKTDRLYSQSNVATWAATLRSRIGTHNFTDDVFIGYCSQARQLALEIEAFIHQEGYRVLDWGAFPIGGELLKEIDKASRTCRTGLFLFTKDDERAETDATPRDNVVLEYGYFLARKPPGHVFLVLEEGAKPPSDIAGIIRATLDDRAKSTTIHTKLRSWLEDTLGPR